MFDDFNGVCFWFAFYTIPRKQTWTWNQKFMETNLLLTLHLWVPAVSFLGNVATEISGAEA